MHSSLEVCDCSQKTSLDKNKLMKHWMMTLTNLSARPFRKRISIKRSSVWPSGRSVRETARVHSWYSNSNILYCSIENSFQQIVLSNTREIWKVRGCMTQNFIDWYWTGQTHFNWARDRRLDVAKQMLPKCINRPCKLPSYGWARMVIMINKSIK